MAAPKPFTVVLLLAVFACVALYVLGVGLGAQQGSSGRGAAVSKEERGRWRERFVKPPPVAEEDVKATGCALSGDTARVVRGLPCRVDIAESGERVRTVNVEPLAGSRVDVTLEPKGGPAVPASLEGLGERRGLDVPEAGARLTLTCTRPEGGGAECRVKLR